MGGAALPEPAAAEIEAPKKAAREEATPMAEQEIERLQRMFRSMDDQVPPESEA